MERIKKVTVFAAFKPFFHIFTIFDLKNFRNQERRILLRHICQATTISMMVLAFIVAIWSDALYCITQKFIVVQIALAFGILINSIQLAITYISIQVKRDLVDEVIARLEKVIIHREYSFSV